MAEPSGTVSASIEAAARLCRSELQTCIGYPHLMELEWAENRLAEFNLWSATTGVFAGEKASLDARLAVDWDTKNLVGSILYLLHGCLKKCQNAKDTLLSDSGDEEEDDGSHLGTPEEIPRGFSPWSDQTSEPGSEDAELEERTTTSLEDAKAEVEQVIDHLTRLAVAIRKSGSNSRAQKADKLFKPEQHQRLRHHLNVLLLARGSAEGRESYEVDSESLTRVQERLVLANLRRRNRYLYAHRHARKLATEHTDHKKAFMTDVVTDDDFAYITSEDLDIHVDKPERDEVVVDEVHSDDPVQMQHPEPSVLTRTTHSAIDQPIEAVLPHATTPSQAAKTNITATAARIEYPRPPNPKKDVRMFQCPGCAQTLPEMFRGTSLWKKHLMADICPYTCIVEDCPKPERLYATRREWTNHVQKEHQQTCWQCPACNNPDMAPLVFPTSESFTKHLNEVHGDNISQAQHPTIFEEAARPVPAGISSCPLCDSTGTADSDELLDHIAEHLHSFALRSLPWAKDEGDDNGDGDEDEPGSDGRDIPHNDLYDDYFDDNNYFAQGSEKGTESKQDNVFTDSERDSEGLASLPSNVSRENVPSRTLVMEIDDEVSLASDDLDSAAEDVAPTIRMWPSALRNSYGLEAVSPEAPPVPMPEVQGEMGREIDKRTREMLKCLLVPDRQRRRVRHRFSFMKGSKYARKVQIDSDTFEVIAVHDRNTGGILVSVHPVRFRRVPPTSNVLETQAGMAPYNENELTTSGYAPDEPLNIVPSHSSQPKRAGHTSAQSNQPQASEGGEEPRRGVRKIWNRLRGKKTAQSQHLDTPEVHESQYRTSPEVPETQHHHSLEVLEAHARDGRLLGPSERLVVGPWYSMIASLIRDSREASEHTRGGLEKEALEDIYARRRYSWDEADWPSIERRRVIERGDVSALPTYERALLDFDHIHSVSNCDIPSGFNLSTHRIHSLAVMILARNVALRQRNVPKLSEVRRYAAERGHKELVRQLDYDIDGLEDISASVEDIMVARQVALDMRSVEALSEVRHWAVVSNKTDWINQLDDDIDVVEDM